MINIADIIVVYFALASVLYLLIGAFIFRAMLKTQSRREWAAILLLLYVLLSFLWLVGQIVPRLEELTFLAGSLPSRVVYYAPLVLALLFLGLTQQFLKARRWGWGWWLLGLLWIGVVIFLSENPLDLATVLWIGAGRGITLQDLGFGALVLGWGSLMGGATLLTLRTYRRTRQPLHRNRIAYWAYALGLTIVGASLFFAGYGALGSGFHLLGTGTVAYLMLTVRLPDMRQVTRRTASYLLVTLLAVILYTAGFLLMQYVLQLVPGYSPLLAAVSIAVVLAVVVEAIVSQLRAAINRAASGTSYDPSRTLREYSTSISNILDLERLATVAVGLISEAMEIRNGALFVVRREDKHGPFHLRGVTAMGEERSPGVLQADSPVAGYLGQKRGTLTQYDVDLQPAFRAMPADERQWLAGLEMDVYVPIHTKDEWIGLLALGPKISGDRYFDGDLALLSTLADQTAVALQNARLFDDLKIQNIENARLNRELTAANRELARLDQSRSDFIQIASHELRTPLTNVRGYIDLLSELVKHEALTTEGGEQVVQGVRTAIQRLEEITKAMFDVSRIDTETLTLKLWPTSLASTVNKAAEAWSSALRQRRQTLTTLGLEDLPVIVADSTRLEQAFSHLIQNAIKFTPNGGEIRVRGRLRDEDLPPEEQTVEIVVADDGIGVAPDDLERVFEKFYRVGDVMLHSTGKTKFKGAGPGLGLTIVRGIVEAHGGFIWAESPGRSEESCPGTEFHVILPVQARVEEPAGLETALADTHG